MSCSIHASSLAETAGCSDGRSRYQANHAAAHTRPIAPTMTKLSRQPQRSISSSAMGTDSMPPTRDPKNITPLAFPRSLSGNHWDSPRDMLGERAGFSGAEQEPRGDERAIPHGCAGQHRERRPPQHDARQHAAGPDDVDEPSRRDFEHRVGERERAQHLAHLDRREMQIVADERRGRRDADAIEIGDDGEEKGEEQDAEPRPRSRGGFEVHRRYSSGS